MRHSRLVAVVISLACAASVAPAGAFALDDAAVVTVFEEQAATVETDAAQQEAPATEDATDALATDEKQAEAPAEEQATLPEEQQGAPAAEDQQDAATEAQGTSDVELQTTTSGWGNEGGYRVWYVNGQVARNLKFTDPKTGNSYWAKSSGLIAENEEYYDPVSNAWYYAGKDGVTITDQDFYLKDQDKTVHYDEKGRMVKGEVYSYFPEDGAYHWRYFHPVTGALQTGFSYVVEQNKWCYYDPETAWMVYGEQFIDGGWYYFDPYTGAMDYDFAYLPKANKWVYYDPVTGRMVYGQRMVDGRPYYFDKVTGRQLTPDELKEKLLQQVRASYYTHPDTEGEFAAAGGTLCPHGPCMTYVWWCFHHADLDIFLADGQLMSYPHMNLDWYKERGRVDFSPKVGDIMFLKYAGFAFDKGFSASHVGIVVGINPDGSVTLADASFNSIEPRWYPINGDTAGIAHPYWGD